MTTIGTTHTPGPWHVGTVRLSDDPWAIHAAKQERLGFAPVVGYTSHGSAVSWDEAQANACLIATAPELLARLEDLATTVAELLIDNAISFDPDDDTGELALRGMLGNASTAIAEGGIGLVSWAR